MRSSWLDQPKWLTRRRLILFAGTATIGLSAELAAAVAMRRPYRRRRSAKPEPNMYEQVLPERGIDTGVRFGDALQKVIAAGALVPAKLRALDDDRPAWVEHLLAGPSEQPIVFTRERAPWLVDLLWPIGLSNRAAFSRGSPINTNQVSGFASTGGWRLGRVPNGSTYFNAVEAVRLTDRQAFLALAVSTNTFRPCCDNSTFFQDCNHGSALLGLIELAAAQGKTADEVYQIALTANSYWFPAQYARTAQYFARLKNRPWHRVSAPDVLGASFSTLSGWQKHVNAPLWQAKVVPPIDPQAQSAAACGL